MDKDDPVEDVKETVVPDAEETTPDEKVVPPVVNDDPKDDIREIVNGLKAQVDELTATVSAIVPATPMDTTPVRKPWTHWGSR